MVAFGMRDGKWKCNKRRQKNRDFAQVTEKMCHELGIIKTTSKPGGLAKERINSEHVLRSLRGLNVKHRPKTGFR